MTNRTIATLLVGAGLAFTPFAAASVASLATATAAVAAESFKYPGVYVEIRSSAGGKSLRVQTDAKGNLSLGELPPGEYTVVIARTELDKVAFGGNGAPRYANIEVNYLLQRMEGMAQPGGDAARRRDVVIRLLNKEHGDLSGTFAVPDAGDARHRHGSTALQRAGYIGETEKNLRK